MSYRIRCKRRARTAAIRNAIYRDWLRRQPVVSFSDVLKRIYKRPGQVEEPGPGFTPNENWVPRVEPDLMALMYEDCPLLAYLPKSVTWTVCEIEDESATGGV